jgi:nitroreductase
VSKNKEIIEAINWRYATKKFDPTKKISAEDLETLKEVLRLTPSSYGLQPWKFLIIEDPELRKELRVHSWDSRRSRMLLTCLCCVHSFARPKSKSTDMLRIPP